jgi:hypothetical protein
MRAAWLGVFGFVVILGSCQNVLHNDDDLPYVLGSFDK